MTHFSKTMITLLHGENIVESRNFLTEKRKKHQGEIINLSGKTVTLGDLKQAVESLTLFTGERLIIIENLFLRTSKNEIKEFIEYLSSAKTSSNIIIWEAEEISKVFLKQIPSWWSVKLFKIPKVIFTFLESISHGKNASMLRLLDKARKTNRDDFLYLMIVRQIRLLILAKENTLSDMPSWMLLKLFRQAKGFSKEELLSLYKKLLLIDIGQKTGTASYDLARELDLFLATL